MADKLVTVASFDLSPEAHLAKDILETHGIMAVLTDELTVGMAWYLSNAVGGIKLQVNESDVEEANALLEKQEVVVDMEEGENNAADLEEFETETPLSEIDKSVDKAFRVALFGLLLMPLQLYSLYILGRIFFSVEKISRNRRWKAFFALMLHVPMIIILAVTLYSILQGM